MKDETSHALFNYLAGCKNKSYTNNYPSIIMRLFLVAGQYQHKNNLCVVLL
jgi:hypothetical protein